MGLPPLLLHGCSSISLTVRNLSLGKGHDSEKLLGKEGLGWTWWSARNFPRIQIDLTAHFWVLERKIATNRGLRSFLH